MVPVHKHGAIKSSIESSSRQIRHDKSEDGEVEQEEEEEEEEVEEEMVEDKADEEKGIDIKQMSQTKRPPIASCAQQDE